MSRALLFEPAVGLDHPGGDVAQTGKTELGALDMIPHVAEEGASRLVDTGELGRGELPGQILHQPRDALKTDDLVPLGIEVADFLRVERRVDRKSTRLNSSH